MIQKVLKKIKNKKFENSLKKKILIIMIQKVSKNLKIHFQNQKILDHNRLKSNPISTPGWGE